MSTALALLILRIVVGLMLAGHGAQKLFGWWGGPGMADWTQALQRMRIRPAQPLAWISALSELGGGLIFAIGFLSPLGSLAIAGTMLVAIALVHWSKGFWVSRGGYEFNLTLVAVAAAVALAGPGPYSLDGALGIQLPEPVTLITGTAAVIVLVAITLLTRSAPEAPGSKPA